MKLPAFPILALLALPPMAASAWAAEDVIARNAQGVTVTRTDIDAEAERFPPDVLKSTFANPDHVRRIAANLLLRRTLALQAEAQGLDKDPKVAARLRLARERVLSDARVQQFDGAPPDEAAIEKLALAEYNANPAPFRIAEAVRLRHILIGQYRQDARQLAERLLEQIRSGKGDFATLAYQYSDDPASKINRGETDFFEKGKLREELAQFAFGPAKEGEVSELIQTDLGWHILKIQDRRAAGLKPFAEVKEDLMRNAARTVVDKRRAANVDPLESGMTFDDEALKALQARYR